MTLRIGIVGAGIGGLACALACAARGHQVVVHEETSAPATAGAGIQLGPNAVKVLRALGLGAALARAGVHGSAIRMRDYRSGRLLAVRQLGPTHEARYGAPYYMLHRQHLVELLTQAAMARNVDVHFGQRVVDVVDENVGTANPQSALVLADGSRHGFDVVVGADGVHSVVRQHMAGISAARFRGCVALRALVASDTLPEHLRQPAATLWLGPGAHFVHYPIAGGSLINVVGVHESDDWRLESWRQSADPTELAAAFAGWHDDVQRLIANTTDCHKWALHDRQPPSAWHRGRAVLLGDACHPILPFLAQGAAMAIEDAWVLAAQLAHAEPAAALAAYQRLREPRVRQVAAASDANARMFHRRSGLAAAARNARLGIGSRWLPGLAMRHYDWLYGDDVTAL